MSVWWTHLHSHSDHPRVRCVGDGDLVQTRSFVGHGRAKPHQIAPSFLGTPKMQFLSPSRLVGHGTVLVIPNNVGSNPTLGSFFRPLG